MRHKGEDLWFEDQHIFIGDTIRGDHEHQTMLTKIRSDYSIMIKIDEILPQSYQRWDANVVKIWDQSEIIKFI